METEKLQKFIENFFKNIKSEVMWKNHILFIDKVPNNFQKFLGKTAPYKFVFEEKYSNEGELITKSSYLVKAISNFLENSGKTTLLKINFNINPEEEVKKYLKFGNCSLGRVSKKNKNKSMTRFTFQTNFQYLNKRDTLINHLFVYDNKVFEIDLSKYEVIEGNKREIEIKGLEKDYETAKTEIKKIISPKVNELGIYLKEKLQKEIERINEHYNQRRYEGQESIVSALEKIQNLKKQKEKNPGDKTIDEKLKRLEKIIQCAKEKNNIGEVNQREEIDIRNEKNKHNLSINNKLINTSVIYYPVFVFDLFLKHGKGGRMTEFELDPLIKEFSYFSCENCKENLDKLNICLSGHLSCENCLKKCGSCGNNLCEKCVVKKCNVCGKEICKNCSATCFSCNKNICKSHLKKEGISGKMFCPNCLKKCPRCFQEKNPKYFKKSPKDNLNICDKCFAKDVGDRTMKDIFR